jgi:hypothetical protein
VSAADREKLLRSQVAEMDRQRASGHWESWRMAFVSTEAVADQFLGEEARDGGVALLDPSYCEDILRPKVGYDSPIVQEVFRAVYGVEEEHGVDRGILVVDEDGVSVFRRTGPDSFTFVYDTAFPPRRVGHLTVHQGGRS